MSNYLIVDGDQVEVPEKFGDWKITSSRKKAIAATGHAMINGKKVCLEKDLKDFVLYVVYEAPKPDFPQGRGTQKSGQAKITISKAEFSEFILDSAALLTTRTGAIGLTMTVTVPAIWFITLNPPPSPPPIVPVSVPLVAGDARNSDGHIVAGHSSNNFVTSSTIEKRAPAH